MMSALFLASARFSKLWTPFVNDLLDGDLCKNFNWFPHFLFFWFSIIILSYTLMIPTSQLQTQQVKASQKRSHIFNTDLSYSTAHFTVKILEATVIVRDETAQAKLLQMLMEYQRRILFFDVDLCPPWTIDVVSFSSSQKNTEIQPHRHSISHTNSYCIESIRFLSFPSRYCALSIRNCAYCCSDIFTAMELSVI